MTSEKRPYESPKVMRLAGNPAADGVCQPGSGDFNICTTGNTPASMCDYTGNSATTTCRSNGNGDAANCLGSGSGVATV
jgi:hypothetical protein